MPLSLALSPHPSLTRLIPLKLYSGWKNRGRAGKGIAGNRLTHSYPVSKSFLQHLPLCTATSKFWVLMSNRKAGKEKIERMGKRGRAAVVVLGDLGRSPRMQYHALSLARQALLEVDVVAYEGSDPHGAVLENSSIHLHKMKPIVIRGLPRLFHLLVLPLKALVQFFVLLWFLCVKIPPPDVFIVQNPPSIPSLIAVRFASWWRQSMFIIDWHNFGYTLLGLSLGRNNILVKIYHWAEKHYGMKADGSLCVTKAMQHELAQNWGIKARVLYDQPPEFFHPTSLQEKHELFGRLKEDLSGLCDIHDCISFGRPSSTALEREVLNANDTLFTTQLGDDIFLKPNRPALIVSSTSWTADEDFSMLLEAAVMYDRRVAAVLNEDDSVDEEMFWMDICNRKQHLYPRLLFIITGKWGWPDDVPGLSHVCNAGMEHLEEGNLGKGPEREKYEHQIKKLHLKRVAFRTMWLSAEDYPLLLGSADLGVCLHMSSSGLDLPMKVVDMFGCGLPVCAVSFSCIEELVKVEKNGLLFSSSSELADELLMLFKGFPDQCDALKSLRDGALATGSTSRWASEWEEHALPLIDEVISRKNKLN